MLSDRLKQRLVGVAVLIALAVIFVPVLFNFQPSRPIDKATRIPPAPTIEPVEIREPVKPEIDNEVPSHDRVFSVGQAPETAPQQVQQTAPPVEEPLEKRQVPERSLTELRSDPEVEPALAESGLPESWVVQVASYSELSSAQQQVERLQAADFKAFHQTGQVGEKQVFRVFVGPFISRDSAEEEKALIDRAAGVDSLVLSFEP